MSSPKRSLLSLAEAYAEHRGISLWRLGAIICNRGSFFVDLKNGRRDCRIETYMRCMQWFSDNWARPPPRLAGGHPAAAAFPREASRLMHGPVLLDDHGKPDSRSGLMREITAPTMTGIRQVWRGQSVAIGLTPQRLAAILLATYDADFQHYDLLTLCEEMEERDPHYAAVLGVRKRAVSKLSPAVESATDDAKDIELADAVRMLVRKPEFGEMIVDCLDALGKGFSAVEIVWDRSGPQWKPMRYEWRDPRFFAFDRVDGRKLMLLDEAGNYHNGIPLEPFKWIVHRPKLKSGIPIRGGLARLVSLSYMAKNYALTDWLAFAEVFGMRLGRYADSATEADIRTLIRAVANLGTDAAAVIPDSMRIEFTEPRARGRDGGGLFERLAVYLDKQISKAVLGQTMTTDDGGSQSQAEVHDSVRGDIQKSDARQLSNTINRDLVKPFIELNFGEQAKYPRLTLPVVEPDDITLLVESLDKLTPFGLKVEASVIRDKLGLPDPPDGADVLGPPDWPPEAA